MLGLHRINVVSAQLCSVLVLTSVAFAQSESEDSTSADEERMRKLFAESQSIVEACRFYKKENGKQIEVPLRKNPVFRHLDSTRNEQGGGIWMVGEKGRPMAMTVLYTFPQVPQWVHSVRSLSTSRDIGATLTERRTWAPREAGLKFEKLPGAPRPKTSKSLRFSQMKQQARRFSGHEFWRDARHELRLIARELHRYEDPENGIIDGAVFSIAHNTNTECYLLIEVQEQNDQQDWYYALARFGYAELHIHIDKKEVWQQPLLNTTGPESPYYLFRITRKTPDS